MSGRPTLLDLRLPPFADAPDRHCAGIPTEMFFPAIGDYQATRAAKRVCLGCPHRTPCEEWATTHGEHGVWGATSPIDRIRGRRHDRG